MVTWGKFLLVALVFICHGLYGQYPYYHLIDKSMGLPSNSVYDIFQDRAGYMWFATGEGLSRYDGTQFTTYFSEEQTSRAGSDIKEDKYGRIWYSNFDGYLYYVAQEKIHGFGQSTPVGYFDYAIIGDFLLCLRKGGVSVYHLKTLTLSRKIDIDEPMFFATCQRDGTFYILGTALYACTGDGMTEKIQLPADFYSLLPQAFMVEATGEGILFASKITTGHYLYSKEKGFIRSKRPDHLRYIHNIAAVQDRTWMLSAKGAYRMSSDYRGTSAYFEPFNMSYVFKDKGGNHWFSTLNKGILLVPDFDNIQIEIDSKPIRLSTDKHKAIVSTEDETLYEINLRDFSTKRIYKGYNNYAIQQLMTDTLSGRIIFTSNTFNVLNNNDYRAQTKSHIAVKDIQRIDNKYYSIAATGFSGLYTMSPQSTSEWDSLYNVYFVAHSHFKDAALLRDTGSKSTIYNTTNKTIYYATATGLHYISRHTQGEIKYNGQPLHIKKLIAYDCTVYGLSNTGKLYSIDQSHRTVPLDPVNDRQIQGIYRISQSGSSIYIYGLTGVYAYDLADSSWKSLTNVRQDYEITDVQEHDDKLIMATSKGILIAPKNTRRQQTATTFIIGDISVNNKAVETTSLANLAYDQNSIHIEYSLLAYAPHEKAALYYRLNTDEWQELSEQGGSLQLSSLAPGDYTVVFKVLNEYGEQYKQVSFTIRRPFWSSVWFLLLLSTIALTLVYLLYRHQIRQHNKRNQEKLNRISLENNLNRSKLKAIKSQMNPHFFYNALNTIQSYILANDRKQAVNYLSKFANLTRTILEMSEKDEVSLAEEIKTIDFYLDIEKARFDGNFIHTIATVGIDIEETIKIPSLLLQPYIENAIKHGLLHKKGEKHLKIIFEKAMQKLTITIEDNGIGRRKSREINKINLLKHKPFATEAIQSRIDLLNKHKVNKIAVNYIDKINNTGQETGTKVIIEVPLNGE